MNNKKQPDLIDAIDDQLPQTQCGLCDYPACKPYAKAIVEQGETIDRCLPGGVSILLKIAKLVNKDPEPYIDEMKQKAKSNMTAIIREAECIGCTKCIQACPVDAIIGAGKLMHTIIDDACTGCELCIAPCPVDCIDMVVIPEMDDTQRRQQAQMARQRYLNREQRQNRETKRRTHQHQTAKLASSPQQTIAARQAAIAESVKRAKAKRQKQPIGISTL